MVIGGRGVVVGGKGGYRTDKTFWRRLFGGRLRQLCRHELNINFFPPTCYQRIHGVAEGGGGRDITHIIL